LNIVSRFLDSYIPQNDKNIESYGQYTISKKLFTLKITKYIRAGILLKATGSDFGAATPVYIKDCIYGHVLGSRALQLQIESRKKLGYYHLRLAYFDGGGAGNRLSSSL